MWLVETILLPGGLGALAAWLVGRWLYKGELASAWNDELARASREFAPRPPRERILAVLHIESGCSRTPMEFSRLRSMSMIGDDMKFWEALRELELDGEVVRVTAPTATSDSLWDLPMRLRDVG